MTILEKSLNRITNIQMKEFLSFKNNAKGGNDDGTISKTIRNYLSCCLIIEEYLVHLYNLNTEQLANFKIQDMTLENITGYQNFLIDIKGCKDSTVNQKLVCLSSLLKYTLKNSSIEISDDEEEHLKSLINALKGRKKIENNNRLTFTKTQLVTLNKYIVNSSMTHRERMLAMFLVIRDTLCQRDNLVNIKLSDVCLDEENPYILLPIQAGGEGVRHSIKRDTVIAIKSYLLIREECDSEYLFISNRNVQIDSGTIYFLFKDMFIDAGFGYLDTNNEMKTDYSIDILRLSFKAHL